jgi:quinol monooxygenase YgiN
MVVSIWKAQAGMEVTEDFRRRIQNELIPVFQRQPGFIDYRAILSDDGHFVVVHTWESQEHCEAGVQETAKWVEWAASWLLTREEQFIGTVGIEAPGP